MSIATQNILFGVTGQYFYLDAPRPITAIASVTVYRADGPDEGATEAATTGAAALPDASTTTAAAVDIQADPKRIEVDDVAGFEPDRRYQITGGGYTETFELEAIDATDSVLVARHPLGNSYAAGAAVDGSLRAAIAVAPSWAADRTRVTPNENPNGGYRVRWEVTLADPTETAVLYTNASLVRYVAAALVNPLDVEAAFPGWLDMLGPDQRRTQGRALIAQAQREVRGLLAGKGLAERALRNAETHAELVIAETIRQTIRDQILRGGADDGRMAMAKVGVDEVLARLVDAPGLPLDRAGGGGATTQVGRGQGWLRR